MTAVFAENLMYSYEADSSGNCAVNNIELSIDKGQLVSILGSNGSGKTTLVRHFNALLPVQRGRLTVAGINAADKNSILAVREKCSMVFQNPDNQFISSLIEEDIAFGARNFGVDESEIPERVSTALAAVGMSGYEKHSPHLLSGGQKQRIAIAGVLAIRPDIIVFDESTSMLDPEGRAEVLSIIKKLHSQGHTVIMISHCVEEAVFSDVVVIMRDGKIIAQGAPRHILTDAELLESAGLELPLPVKIYYDIAKRGINLSKCPLTNKELVEELCLLS